MPQFLVTAKVLVDADNQVAALDAAAAVIQHYDPVNERFCCKTALEGAEVRVEQIQPRASGRCLPLPAAAPDDAEACGA